MEEGSLFQRMKQIFHEDEMDEEMQKEAAALIRNIFRYMDKDAKDIMTHRKNIVAIDGDWSLEEALKFMLDERFSRFPVYQEDIDEIIGIIHLRDATSGYLDESKRGCPVKELKEYLRPVTYIPETKSIDTLFKEMQSTKNHMVIVLDEYGQTSGLVAMEDILEEIVGEIHDEYDENEEDFIKQIGEREYIVEGSTNLDDLNDRLDLDLTSEEYDSVGGFIIEHLDRLPEIGDGVTTEDGIQNRKMKKETRINPVSFFISHYSSSFTSSPASFRISSISSSLIPRRSATSSTLTFRPYSSFILLIASSSSVTFSTIL